MIAVLLSSCVAATASGGQGRLGVETMYSSAMCDAQIQVPQVTWIDTHAGLRQVFDRVQGGRLHQGAAPAPPPLDFGLRAVVLLAMGMQPSAGYGLTLRPRQWSVTGDTLILRVDWLTPPPGRVFTQVVTHPCLLVNVPRDGYHRIEVLDQHGMVRMRGGVNRLGR